jgi:hypothetical protein
MKDLVKRAKSFMTFDYPLQTAYISSQFAGKHEKFQKEITGWSTAATRQMLISEFWFRYVAHHFGIVFGIPALLFFLFYAGLERTGCYLLGCITAGTFSYAILYLFHYRPWFSAIFLPRLETVKEMYEHKQIERLEKCRQAQLSNFSLTLVFYVFDKAAGMNALHCSDPFAALLMKLYGVDKGSLKKNLELIFTRKKSISERRSTEISNRFSETYTFFEELNFPKGIIILKELESKFFKAQIINEINFPR